MRDGRPEWIYFMRPMSADGPIKIGCSGDPEARLRHYMAWSPIHLEIVARMPGNQRLERRIHAAIRDAHSHHEWFHPTPAVLSLLGAVQADSFDPASLPAKGWLAGNPSRRRAWSEGQRLRFRVTRAIRSCGHFLTETNLIPYRFDDLGEAEKARLRLLVEAIEENPHRHGSPVNYPWAVAARAKYAADRGLMLQSAA